MNSTVVNCVVIVRVAIDTGGVNGFSICAHRNS